MLALDIRKNQAKDWWYEISDSERTSIEQGISDSDFYLKSVNDVSITL